MENRFQNSQPEELGWGAYVTPPALPEPQSAARADAARTQNLCVRVVELLPALLENDGEVRPEMATAVYSHLALCPHCAQEFDEMQRVVAMIESVTPVELPMDFSGLIMQRIQNEAETPSPSSMAASSEVSEEAAVRTAPQALSSERMSDLLKATDTSKLRADAARVGVSLESLGQSHRTTLERFTVAGVLFAALSFCCSTSWGRQMLGVNLQSASAWLEQVSATLQSVPGLGLLVTFILAALSPIGRLIEETYRTLGATAAQGILLDVGLCAAAYYFFITRRRRGQDARHLGGL